MRVAVTGTPGTGKTSATNVLSTDLDVIHLNDVITKKDFFTEIDEERNSLVADIEAVQDWLGDRDDILIESHLAHYLDVDKAIVLRCHPEELVERLLARGETREKAEENAESEALDGILIEAVDNHGSENVFEIHTTGMLPEETAREIERVIDGDRDPSAGEVDFTDYL